MEDRRRGARPTRAVLAGLGLVLAALPAVPTLSSPRPPASPPGAARAPLAFEANAGQVDARVRFVARQGRSALFLAPTEAVLARTGETAEAVVRTRFVGADPDPAVVGQGRLGGVANYLLGDDPARWRTGVATYARVTYRSLWPGIDLAYYGRGDDIEYDVVVAPGADPARARFALEGPEGLALDRGGALVATLGDGSALTQRPPVAYQDGPGGRRRVPARFVRHGPRGYGFAVGAYDRTRPLVIDPVVSFGTYLGGGDGDALWDVAVDGTGHAYLAGGTYSRDFPLTAGTIKAPPDNSYSDAVVVKFDPTGAVVWSTLFGGTNHDSVEVLAVDGAGNAYVAGTASDDFPARTGSYTLRGTGRGWYVAKLDASGTRLLSGFHFGIASGVLDIGGIAVDGAGNAYVAGGTTAQDFPVTPGAYQTGLDGSTDGFVLKVNAAGTQLVWSTYLGGERSDGASGVAVDGTGRVHLSGATNSSNFPVTPGAFQTTLNQGADSGGFAPSGDAFAAVFEPDGSALVWATYLGGGGSDGASDLALDGAGAVYLTGFTVSRDNLLTPLVNEAFPTTPGAYDRELGGGIDIFVAKLAPGGAALAYGTYLGGTRSDYWFECEAGKDIAVDGAGRASVTGLTCDTPDFPTTPDAFQPTKPTGGIPGQYDAFVTTLSADGSALAASSYLGGGGNEEGRGIAVDGAGAVWVAGGTSSCDFPVTAGAPQAQIHGRGWREADPFVVKVSPPGTPAGPLTLARCGLDPVPAGPGSLEAGFGEGGMVVTDLGSGSKDVPRALAVQPDGKVVVVGTVNSWADQGMMVGTTAVVRYRPDGSLDPGFGAGGVVRSDALEAYAVVLQPHAGVTKVVVAGAAARPGVDGSTDVVLARFGPDGALDPSFGSGGVVRTPVGTQGAAFALALAPDGALVAAGTTPHDTRNYQGIVVVRYRPDGTPDPSFGTDGVVTTEVGAPGTARARAVAVQPDAKVVVAGGARDSRDPDRGDFLVLRYRPDGTLDPDFGTGGVVRTNFETFVGGVDRADRAAALTLLDDGRLLVAGTSDNGDNNDFALARYRPDGSLDPAFGVGGILRTDFTNLPDAAGALVVDPAGRAVAAGSGAALARYHPDGALDPDFGAGGRANHRHWQGYDRSTWRELERLVGLARLPDGALVGTGPYTYMGDDGTRTYDFALVRVVGERPSALAFTAASAPGAQHSDPAPLQARLTDAASGAPLAGATVRFELSGAGGARSLTATTDADGLAAATWVVDLPAGPYRLAASYGGEPRAREPAAAEASFSVAHEDTALALALAGDPTTTSLEARLSDADSGAGVGAKTVVFSTDGEVVGSATTDGDGRASLALPPRYQSRRTYQVHFAGDAAWAPATTTTST